MSNRDILGIKHLEKGNGIVLKKKSGYVVPVTL